MDHILSSTGTAVQQAKEGEPTWEGIFVRVADFGMQMCS